MRRFVILLGIMMVLTATASNAVQTDIDSVDDLFYVTSKSARLYRDSVQTQPYVRLHYREPVSLLKKEGKIKKVRTMDGATGYVNADQLSNIWIHVSKRRKLLVLYRGMEVISTFNADFGYNGVSDKLVRGSDARPDHWRTPEGVFYVVKKNPYSQFYRAFLLNYPNEEDAKRGLHEGLISRSEYNAIILAEKRGLPPPMQTSLGGLIEIHGNGTGASSNWTEGCVAVRDADMDFMWSYVQEGTPVVIEK